ncbi:uncharacterized protein EKO05_0006603 [Ascochyta rabiei]|uniref:Uncharacterized protein n=1 Tax=Didymella rabiei TaxID=5454 RepID=A0A162VXY4_DIDRA|nr:uncharacterized protein EKO05_0006603 [Ascochyta rabiei]KZM18666.1 hypothetical protein ST47_g10038 [Ascochyta rabiei]UPX16189.1 hypothetical protein EKO05_0006603 [Ascochyta rabiei]
MTQTLYGFGVDPSHPANKTTTPTAIHTTTQISILWVSWCDLIYTTCDSTNAQATIYRGTSLNASQQERLTSLGSIDAFSADPQCRLSFFGSTMHDGLRGYILGHKICIFGTPAEKVELGSQYSDITNLSIPSPFHHDVRICSDASLLLATRPVPDKHAEANNHKRTAEIGSIEDMQGLKDHCYSITDTECLASFTPTQLVVNATTATALDAYGRVHTRTADPRYPACAGRPHTGTSKFEPVAYLSETRITKIASGGYMTAAISEDGELFLWGQSTPGTDGELGVLHRQNYDSNAALEGKAIVWCDAEQDEYVKCLNITIGGNNATAFDVAIGFGHVLVAAKNSEGEHVVLVAGCGSEGQLGLGRTVDFLEEFELVVATKGKLVVQVEAAGWSSFVVTEDGGLK